MSNLSDFLGVSYTLPVASSSTLGGVKQGAGVSIDGSGVLSVTFPSIPTASGSTLGGVIIDSSPATGYSSLSIDGSGNLTVPKASSTVFGTVETSSHFDFDSNGKLILSAALGMITGSSAAFTTAGSHFYLDIGGVNLLIQYGQVALTGGAATVNLPVSHTSSLNYIAYLTAHNSNTNEKVIANVSGQSISQFYISAAGLNSTSGAYNDLTTATINWITLGIPT